MSAIKRRIAKLERRAGPPGSSLSALKPWPREKIDEVLGLLEASWVKNPNQQITVLYTPGLEAPLAVKQAAELATKAVRFGCNILGSVKDASAALEVALPTFASALPEPPEKTMIEAMRLIAAGNGAALGSEVMRVNVVNQFPCDDADG